MPRSRNESDVGFLRKRVRIALRSAAAHDDARRGIEFLHARHALAGFFFRLARDGAGIQNIQIGGDEFVRDLVAEFGKPLHERTALAVVHLAAERKESKFHAVLLFISLSKNCVFPTGFSSFLLLFIVAQTRERVKSAAVLGTAFRVIVTFL